jgi:hypothetical protein
MRLWKLCKFFISAGIVISSLLSAFAQGRSPSTSNPFVDYFYGANAKDIGTDKGYPAYEALMRATQTMAPTEIAAGLAVIDSKIDANMSDPQDYSAKGEAVSLLGYIGSRPDGPELLATQMDRLAFLLNEPTHRFTPASFAALQMIGYRRPQLVVPILKDALKNPEANNKTGPGSGVSALLLRLAPNDQDVAERVVQYMQRKDMTDDHLLDTIVGIDNSPIPDAIAAELVRCLDRPNDIIKGRALVGLSKSSPAAKEAARRRIQDMANDPRETTHIRSLAAEVPEGKIVGNPDVDQQKN